MLIMLHKLGFFSLSLLALAGAAPLSIRSRGVVEKRRCGTVVTDGDLLIARNALHELWDSLDAREVVNRTGGLKPVAFDVYWHVVYANQTTQGGYVSDKQIADQMEVMNADYKSANISFTFKNTTRIENADWFINAAPGMPQERVMKQQFHKGDSTALNIFTAQFNDTTPTLGYASLPSSYQSDPVSDGVIVRHSVLPGGSTVNYNHGRTTVHEIGHWLGLYHTFEGGCEGVGDNIADTAPESSGADGCPAGRKSCSNSPLLDPIHNFMDYSWDMCMTHFTPGQAVRMHEVIWAFRTKRPPVANSTATAVTSPATQTSTTGATTSASETVSNPVATPTGSPLDVIPEVEVEVKPEDSGSEGGDAADE
jgi:hypothetical protein